MEYFDVYPKNDVSLNKEQLVKCLAKTKGEYLLLSVFLMSCIAREMQAYGRDVARVID